MRKALVGSAILAPVVAMAQTTVPPDPEMDSRPWPDGAWLFIALIAILFWAFFAKSGVFYSWAEAHPVLAWIAVFAVPATVTLLLT